MRKMEPTFKCLKSEIFCWIFFFQWRTAFTGIPTKGQVWETPFTHYTLSDPVYWEVHIAKPFGQDTDLLLSKDPKWTEAQSLRIQAWIVDQGQNPPPASGPCHNLSPLTAPSLLLLAGKKSPIFNSEKLFMELVNFTS